MILQLNWQPGTSRMKVDMSPEAVTARLNLAGQLWELSVKLRQAEKRELAKVEDSEAGLLDERPLAGEIENEVP